MPCLLWACCRHAEDFTINITIRCHDAIESQRIEIGSRNTYRAREGNAKKLRQLNRIMSSQEALLPQRVGGVFPVISQMDNGVRARGVT